MNAIPFLVSDNLDSNKLAGFMVVRFDHLTKRSLAKKINNFVTVSDVIAGYLKTIRKQLNRTATGWCEKTKWHETPCNKK